MADGTRSDAVLLSVTNGGVIPPEVLPSIFDPFRRGGRTSARAEGLGLGLYIVQQIVLAHGGTVEAHTLAGEKTEFRVTVPRG